MAIRRARQDVVKSVRRERGEESGWLMSDGPKNLRLRLAHGIQLLHGGIGLHAHRGAPEDLARCIGCELRVHPRQNKALYRKCTEGPMWAIQYRLRGPEARPERARQIILDKTPVPFEPSPWLRLGYGSILWLRYVLPLPKGAKPRYI